MICLTERARAALRPHEVLVFDWVTIALCCASAGEPSLRVAPAATVSAAHRPLPACGSSPVAMAHPAAYPHLVGLDVTVDQRPVLGIRRFVTDLPPDFGLRAALGRPAPPPAPTTAYSDPTSHVHQSPHGGSS